VPSRRLIIPATFKHPSQLDVSHNPLSPLRQAIEARSLAGGCEADHMMGRPLCARDEERSGDRPQERRRETTAGGLRRDRRAL
jgi:hypothetical protein